MNLCNQAPSTALLIILMYAISVCYFIVAFAHSFIGGDKLFLLFL